MMFWNARNLDGAAKPSLRAALVGLVAVSQCFSSALVWAAPPADTTPLRRSKDLEQPEREDTYSLLAKEMKDLVLRHDVAARARDALAESFDGSPKMATQGNLLGIIMVRDRVSAVIRLSATIEDLRWNARAEFQKSEVRKKQREAVEVRSQQEIDELAQMLVAGRDSSGSPLGEDSIAGMRATVYELVLKRDEAKESARVFRQNAQARQKELENLDRVDERLYWYSVRMGHYVERLESAVQSQSAQVVAAKSKEQGKAVREAVALLEFAEEAGTKVIWPTVPEGEGPIDQRTTLRVPADLSPEESTRVDEELRAAGARLGIPGAAPAKPEPSKPEDKGAGLQRPPRKVSTTTVLVSGRDWLAAFSTWLPNRTTAGK